MNFLAHIYLSGNNDEMKIGGVIADWVKGRQIENYPSDIRLGIELHRIIDSFTDSHKIVLQSKSYFSPVYQHYSAIIVDVVYDYFLSKNWEKYSSTDLQQFVQHTYFLLDKYIPQLPSIFQQVSSSLHNNNWLGIYGSYDGLRRVFNKMSAKTSLPNYTESAIQILEENEDNLQAQFFDFFDEVSHFTIDYLKASAFYK